MRHHQTLSTAAAALTLLTLAAGSPAAATAAPANASATAQFGSAEAWIAPDPDQSGRRVIAYSANEGAAAKVLASGIKRVNEGDDLALGTDGHGKRVVVVTTRSGLASVPVSGGELRQLRFSTSTDAAPSVLGGRVAFTRAGRSVMVAGLTRRTARVVASASGELRAFTDTAVGAGGSVAWVRYLESEAPRYRVELHRPGSGLKRLHELRTDITTDGSLRFGAASTNGKVLNVSRTYGSQRTGLRFALPNGARR